jgi:hypothetical protein
MTAAWVEYAEEVAYWDALVDANPSPDTFSARWQARIRHPSWAEKRDIFLWYTRNHCERCGSHERPEDLELHHRHYDTLWYENNGDLELLCHGCHREADRERRANKTGMSHHERAVKYMRHANRYSGQSDWPVTFAAAMAKVLDEEDDWENDW